MEIKKLQIIFTNINSSQEKNILNFFIGIFLVFFMVILIRNAWVSDDAYITFRTVDNFIHGHGLTWNIGERVQVYTHPLWMLLLSIFYFFTREIFFTVTIISILIVVTLVGLFAFRISISKYFGVIGIGLFCCSKAFIDYATSGLENPLTYLMIVVFFLLYFSNKQDLKTIFFLSFITALGILNRMDTALLFIPPLIYFFIKARKMKGRIKALILGLLPFLIWELFSLFYYGFPFPNTAYAKLNTGIPWFLLVEQGFNYFIHSFQIDPVTLIIIAGSLAFSFFIKKGRTLPVAIGIILYLTYILKIGGCFMSGRYFAAPFLCAVIILSRITFKHLKYAGLPILFFMLIIGLINPYSPIHTGAHYNKPAIYNYQISDERDVYYKSTGLLVYGKDHALPQSQFAIDGKKIQAKGKSVIKSASVGIAGFYAGPEVHIIDMYALGDPLLARINIMNRKRWRIGHFPRAIPFNYKQTLEFGMITLNDPDLARFYTKISLIVRGDLFSIKRLYEIWNMNLGKYNYLIDKYCQNPLKIHFRDLKRKKSRGSWMDDDVLMFSEQGLLVDMGSIYHPEKINISVDTNDNYQLQLYKEGTMLKEYDIPIRMETNIRGLLNYEIKIDAEVQKNGCDMIKIIPQRGDGFYSIGSLILD